MMDNHSYFADAENLSWSQLRSLCERKYASPISLRVPMNLPFSRDLVYQSPAFEIIYRALPPRLDRRSDRTGWDEEYEKGQSLMLSFFFGDPAFIPDYRLTRLAYVTEGAPVLQSSFFLRDLFYEMESFTAPALPGEPPVLHARFTIRNAGVEPYRGTVRLHLSRPDRQQIGDPYYVMARDNEHVPLNDDFALFTDDGFATKEETRGKVQLGIWSEKERKSAAEKTTRVKVRDFDGWEMTKEETLANHPDDYARTSRYGTHHHFFQVQMQHRIHTAKRLLKFSREIKPGESVSFTLLYDVSGQGIGITEEAYDSAKARCIAYYRELLGRDGAKFDFGTAGRNANCRNNLFQTLQMMRDQGMEDGTLALVQAYSCYRPMWNLEARYMLEGLMHFGFFPEVRRFLKLMMTWQDAECHPQGDFDSLEGAIGNTGPGWAATTGCALTLAAKYVRFSGDKAFYEEYRNQLLRAAKWILHEVAETRRKGEGLAAGLMPPARCTDEDVGCFYVASDNVLVEGLQEYLGLEEVQKEPEYPELLKETLLYRNTIRRVAETLKRDDGFIPRTLPLAAEIEGKVHFKKFNTLCGAFHLTAGHVLDEEEPLTLALYRYFETHEFREFWSGPMDEDCVYAGLSDLPVFRHYLATGEWKKAWGVLKYLLLYGQSADLNLTLERLSLSERAFAGLQNNASGNGRQLSMLTASLCFVRRTHEGKEMVTLLGGVAPFELADEPHRHLDFYTENGRILFDVQKERLMLKRTNPFSAGTLLRLPEHFPLTPDDAEHWLPAGPNSWAAKTAQESFSGTLTIGTQAP